MNIQRNRFLVMGVTLLALIMVSSCTGGKLTDAKAKAAAIALLEQDASKLPSNQSATLKEWQGLVQISETEMHGKASVYHRQHQSIEKGSFIFHKTSDNKWVLDHIEFRNPVAWWGGEVFQKVE